VLARNPVRAPADQYRRSSVHRDGRLLAVGSSQGVSLFDLANGLDVGHLDIGFSLTAQFDPATGDLLTHGSLGLLRWPVRAEPGDANRLRIGPPRRLLARPASDNEFRISRDGRTIAVAQYTRVLVLHADQPGRPVILPISAEDRPWAHARQQVSISPDGRWVATGSHGGGDVHVWEARSGRLVKSQRVNGACNVHFTPDGERLLVRTECDRFWRVGDWEMLPPLPETGTYGYPEFTPDGRFFAWESGEGAVRLLNGSTGREVFRLESPDQGRCSYLTFSPDGRLLVATNHDYPAVHVWDLHELRRQLQGMELDWPAGPDVPAAKEGPPVPRLPPLQVEDDLGALAGLAQKRAAGEKLNREAWPLVVRPAGKQDSARALKLMQEALQLVPDEPMWLNTLGVAQYRNGQYQEALATLEKSLVAGLGESDAYDLFFLAMCHARLGDAARARDCFDRALKWQQQATLEPRQTEELRAFRAEAEALLR
jgi:hypothetical protein